MDATSVPGTSTASIARKIVGTLAARVSTMQPIGARRWAIAEGYIPGWSHGPQPEMASHETACLLNVCDEDAQVTLTLFFSDREPLARTA